MSRVFASFTILLLSLVLSCDPHWPRRISNNTRGRCNTRYSAGVAHFSLVEHAARCELFYLLVYRPRPVSFGFACICIPGIVLCREKGGLFVLVLLAVPGQAAGARCGRAARRKPWRVLCPSYGRVILCDSLFKLY